MRLGIYFLCIYEEIDVENGNPKKESGVRNTDAVSDFRGQVHFSRPRTAYGESSVDCLIYG